MSEMWVRGNFFQQALDYVKGKWGQDGLDQIGEAHENYQPEKTYPFENFCELLLKISNVLGEHTSTDFSKLGGDMVKNDQRWPLMFKGQDPKDVFSTTKRQDDRYQVGTFELDSVKSNEVKLTMKIKVGKQEHQDLWVEFYKGRLAGVLELTGYEGSVEVKKGKKGVYRYTIKWER